VNDARPVFEYVVTFGPTVASALNTMPFVDRSITKFVSFVDRSVHDKSIWLLETTVAVRFDGAVGTVLAVCASATFDHADGPAAFVARTR
jgi:hypothetical protein